MSSSNSSSNSESTSGNEEHTVHLVDSAYQITNGITNGIKSSDENEELQNSEASESEEQINSENSSSRASDSLPISSLRRIDEDETDSGSGDDYTPNKRTKHKRQIKHVNTKCKSNLRTRGKKLSASVEDTAESQSSSEENDSDDNNSVPTRHSKYESDHSYHMEKRNFRYIETQDSDSDDCVPRTRRGLKLRICSNNTSEVDDESLSNDLQPGPSGLNAVRTRRGKRPHYNEDSEEEVKQNPAKRAQLVQSNGNGNCISPSQPTSVSSRGRVRKLTAKAQDLGILRD